jgi:hypothetical protein
MPMHAYDNMSGQVNAQFVKLIQPKSIKISFNNLHLLQN